MKDAEEILVIAAVGFVLYLLLTSLLSDGPSGSDPVSQQVNKAVAPFVGDAIVGVGAGLGLWALYGLFVL